MKNKIVTRVIPSLALATAMFASNVGALDGSDIVKAYDVSINKQGLDHLLNMENLEDKTIIVQSNDSHGAIDGFKYPAALEDKLESMGAEVITVDCGDYNFNKTSGKDYVGDSDGRSAVHIMNEAGYDITCPGNHEFDDGWKDYIEKTLPLSTFKVICANLVNDKGEPILTPNCTYTTENGTTIGFFGLDTGETIEKNKSKNSGVTALTGQALYDCATAQIKDLKNIDEEPSDNQNPTADIVICLAHLGVDEERRNAGDRSSDVYDHTSGIDLILDANSHTVMTSGEKDAPIMSTGAMFENVGIVVIDGNSIQERFLIPVSDLKSLTEDPEIAPLIKSTEDTIEAAKRGEFDNDKKGNNSNNGKKDKDKDRDKDKNRKGDDKKNHHHHH